MWACYDYCIQLLQFYGWAIAAEYATTVNLAVPVFHLFSSGNPALIIYMDELRVHEFGMTFHLQCFIQSRYEFHIQYISTFYAKLVWWNNIP